VRHLLAVQAQDERALPFALQARGGSFREGLYITWLMRGTLHLVDRDDLAWLHPLFAPRMAAGSARRLRQLGVREPDLELVARSVPATRAELGEVLGLRGQALAHVLARAAMEGRVAMTPDRVFVALSLPPPGDRDRALDELARRYYACHAGAEREDLAYWSGLPLRDCRPPGDRPHDDGPVPTRLLPAFDELLLGWRDRSPTVPPEHARAVHPGGGILRAVILEDGVAVGTWTQRGGQAVELRRWTSTAS
jgi:winged helix DNA-binding protein